MLGIEDRVEASTLDSTESAARPIYSSHWIYVISSRRHDGPVWQVAWAHPKFGKLLASCSYDAQVIVWKETQTNVWDRIYQHKCRSSVNSISWAPHTTGLSLAAACADGFVSVFTRTDDHKWAESTFEAHKGGCNAVCWGPDVKISAVLQRNQIGKQYEHVRQFVTGGCDGCIRIWR